MAYSHLISMHDGLQNTCFFGLDWNLVLPGINWLRVSEGACLLCIHLKTIYSSNEFTSGNKRFTSAGMVCSLSHSAEEIKRHLSVEAALKGHAIINIRPRKFSSYSWFVGVWCISCYRRQEYMVEKAHLSALICVIVPVPKFIAVFLLYFETWVIQFM
jgi:hypothetical protein